MYTVLIAEDEMLVRMGLTVSVPWEKIGMRVIGEVADGQKALEIFHDQKPDILITDLSMPGLDGISLIKKVRESKIACAVIVITCMDRFELLHEAMELGVIAYLVKATMSTQDIENALEKAKNNLGAPRQRDSGDQKNRVEALYKQYVFNSKPDYTTFIKKAEKYNHHPLPGYYVLCANAKSSWELSMQLQKALKTMLADRLRNQHIIYILQQEGFLTILFSRTPKVHDITQTCKDYSQYIYENFGVEVMMVSSMECVALQYLPRQINRMKEILDADSTQHTSLLWVNENGAIVDTHIKAEFEHLREGIWQISNFKFALKAITLLDELEEAFKCSIELFLPKASAFANLLWKKADISREQKHILEKGLAEEVTGSDILQYIYQYAIEKLPRYRREVCRVIVYIANNLDGNLSLGHAAALIAMHPQYLSNLFKKEVGISYSEFICVVRLMEAKRMLRNPAINIQTVSEKCGFSDKAYFYRKFKQLTGLPPVEWRRNQG